MTGYKVVNLRALYDEIGEDATNRILSSFSCPMNKDVEYYLLSKAVAFARQSWAQTHLVFASFKGEAVLVGYFALANKEMQIPMKFVGSSSSNLRKRIRNFATLDKTAKSYFISSPLIAQLGKNYTNGYDKLITGAELLAAACDKVKRIQYELGGRFVYIECEDKPKLINFYSRNGFVQFDTRRLDGDETDKLSGEYLVQMLKYIK